MSQSLDRPLESPRHRRTSADAGGGGDGGGGRGGGNSNFGRGRGGGGRDGFDTARGRGGGRDFGNNTRGGRSRGRGRGGRGHFTDMEGGRERGGGHFTGRGGREGGRGRGGRGRFNMRGGGRGRFSGGHDEDGSVVSRFSEDNVDVTRTPVFEDDTNTNHHAAAFPHDDHARANRAQVLDGSSGGQHSQDLTDTHRSPFHESPNNHRNVTQPPENEIRPTFNDESNSIHRGFTGNHSHTTTGSRPTIDESSSGIHRGTYGEILSNEQFNFIDGRAPFDSKQGTMPTRDKTPFDDENSRVAQFDTSGRGRGRYGAFDGRGRGRNFDGNGRGRGRYIDRDGRGRMGTSRGGGGRDGRGGAFAFGRGRVGDTDRNDRWQGRGHDMHTTSTNEWPQQNRTEQPSSYASIAGSDDAEPGEWRENDRIWNEEHDHRFGQSGSDGDRQQGNNFSNNKNWDTGRNSFQRDNHRANFNQQHGNRQFQQQDWKQEPREANYTTMADSHDAPPTPVAPPLPPPAPPEPQEEGPWRSYSRGSSLREDNEWNAADLPSRENPNQEWVQPRVNLPRDTSYAGLVGNDSGWKKTEMSTDLASPWPNASRGWNQQESKQSSSSGWDQHDPNQGSGNERYQADIPHGSQDVDVRSRWNNRAAENRDGNYDDAFAGAASSGPGMHYGPASEAAFPPPTMGGGRGRTDDGRGRGRGRGGRTFEGRGGYDRVRGRGIQLPMSTNQNDGLGMNRKRDFDNRSHWEFQQSHDYTRNDSFELHQQDEKRMRESREGQTPIDSPVRQMNREPQLPPPPKPQGPPPPVPVAVPSWPRHSQQIVDENDRAFPSNTPAPQGSASESYEQSPLSVPLFRESSSDFNSFPSSNSRGGRGGRFPARGFDRGGNRGRGRHFAQDDRGGRGRGFDGRGYGDSRMGGYGRGNYGPEGRGFQGRGFAAGNRNVVPLPPPQPEWQSSAESYVSYAALATQPPPTITKLEDTGTPAMSSSEQEIAKSPTPPPPPPPVVKSPSPPPPPPSPPPEPVPPSSFLVSLVRLVEAESQLDYVLAKHLQLVRKRKLLRAQIEKLESLPIGADAFKEDLDKLIADLAQSEEETARRRKQEAEEDDDDLYAELDGDGS